MNLDWLSQYEEDVLGPIQRDEAILLYGVARTLRAKRILEFGSGQGFSARVWLEAGAADVVCVEWAPSDALRALHAQFPQRLRFIIKDMAQIEPEEIDGPWDIVFFDAGHLEAVNKRVFEALRVRWRSGLLVLHDTGLWAYGHMRPRHFQFPGENTNDGFAHQPGERAFARWLEDLALPRINFHSRATLRHGLTFFELQDDRKARYI